MNSSYEIFQQHPGIVIQFMGEKMEIVLRLLLESRFFPTITHLIQSELLGVESSRVKLCWEIKFSRTSGHAQRADLDTVALVVQAKAIRSDNCSIFSARLCMFPDSLSVLGRG